jgi:hypothetical protein
MKHLLAALLAVLVASSALAITPGTDLYVPAVGHGVGAVVNGIQAWWRSDVWIFNPSTTQAATVDISLLLRKQANPNPAVRRITVNAGETRYLQDIVGPTPGLFNLDNTYGGLRIVSTIPVAVSGRSYDANVTVTGKGQGTAGQFFSGVPASLAIGPGDSTDVFGLDQDGFQTTGNWRSNLAFVETTGNPVELTIQRIDSDGTVLGSIPFDLLGRQVDQINYVVTAIASSYGANQRIRVTVNGGTGRAIVNASRLDNRTGDPTTIEMVGEGRAGTYVCKQDKAVYETPITLTVANGAITAIDATIVFTDEDVTACGDAAELLRLSGPLPQPVFYDGNGSFSFVLSNPNVGGVGVSLQVNGTISVTGQVSGTATTTLSGADLCSGTKTWPLVGAKLR